MKIEKSNSGGVILKDGGGAIIHIIKSNAAYLHTHPRNDAAVIISAHASAQQEREGMAINASQVTEIDGQPFSGDRTALLAALEPLFVLGGGTERAVYIEGYKFTLVKADGNRQATPEAGDLALHGWLSATEFGELLKYQSGPPSERDSWGVLKSIDLT